MENKIQIILEIFNTSSISLENFKKCIDNELLNSYIEMTDEEFINFTMKLLAKVLSKDSKQIKATHKKFDDLIDKETIDLIHFICGLLTSKEVVDMLNIIMDMDVNEYIKSKYGSLEEYVIESMKK